MSPPARPECFFVLQKNVSKDAEIKKGCYYDNKKKKDDGWFIAMCWSADLCYGEG